MVTGSTTLLGIIGKPVTHSLSPAMHNAAFAALEMDWLYVPLPVEPEGLPTALKGVPSLGFRGVNVTVPYKERVIPFLSALSPEASAIGAVNTISIQAGRLVGENTDWSGFLADLTEQGFDPFGSEALILGSGGSSKAVAYALLSRGAQVVVAARNAQGAAAMVENLGNAFPRKMLSSTTFHELADLEFLPDLIVNTTPLGMSPQVGLSPWPESVAFPACRLAYDLVYAPPVTRFLEQASAMGIRTACGMGMLIHQAAESFRIWTGGEAPVNVMKRAAEAGSVAVNSPIGSSNLEAASRNLR